MKVRYYAEPGTAVMAPFGESGETRRIEFPSSGWVDAEDGPESDFLAAFADSPAHPVTSQPPDEKPKRGKS